MSEYTVKDSGARQVFDSGMQRDTTDGKLQFHRVFEGPMLKRWATHLTKGAAKYPDRENGEANWTLAAGEEELRRFKASAIRHFSQWVYGETDEDHAAAVFFNLNGHAYVEEKLESQKGAPRPQWLYFPADPLMRDWDAVIQQAADSPGVEAAEGAPDRASAVGRVFAREWFATKPAENLTGTWDDCFNCSRNLRGLVPWCNHDARYCSERCFYTALQGEADSRLAEAQGD